MTLVISSPKCKTENTEKVQSALDILDKFNIIIMISDKQDDVNLHKNEIRSNLLNLNKSDSKLISKRPLLYKTKNEPKWVYFPFHFGNTFIEVFDKNYF